MWAVSIVWLNGVKTVTLFPTQEQALKHAIAMLEFKGVRIFIGSEVERSAVIVKESNNG